MDEIHYDDGAELVEGLARVVGLQGDVAWLERTFRTSARPFRGIF